MVLPGSSTCVHQQRDSEASHRPVILRPWILVSIRAAPSETHKCDRSRSTRYDVGRHMTSCPMDPTDWASYPSSHIYIEIHLWKTKKQKHVGALVMVNQTILENGLSLRRVVHLPSTWKIFRSPQPSQDSSTSFPGTWSSKLSTSRSSHTSQAQCSRWTLCPCPTHARSKSLHGSRYFRRRESHELAPGESRPGNHRRMRTKLSCL
jgi:hypothetical protein